MNDRDIEDTRQPDELPEAQYCEDCRRELTLIKLYRVHDETGFSAYCGNDFCPSKFAIDSVSEKMAERIVELEGLVERIESSRTYLSRKIAHLEFNRDEGE